MRLIGLLPVRNEAHVLGLSARVALQWCDELVIGGHACTDGSWDIIYGLMKLHPITALNFDGQWDEMQHREALLQVARGHKATHVAIIDADEILTGNLRTDIRQHIELMPRNGILQLPGYNLRNSLYSYHSNGIWGYRWFSTAFVDSPELSWSGDKFHSREPGGKRLTPYKPIAHGDGGIMHLWANSERRIRAKSALYKCTERLRWPNKPVPEIDQMYNWAVYGQPGHPSFGTPETWTYADVPHEWWAPYHDLKAEHLHVDAEPYQEAEIRRLIALHGRAAFDGLDLFGVVL